MKNQYFTTLRTALPDLDWQSQAPLAPFTYMKVGGPAEVLLVVKRREDLVRAVRTAWHHNVPVTIVGGASNVVVSDAGLPGLVVINQADEARPVEFSDVVPEIADDAVVEYLRSLGECRWFLADSGIKTALLVRATIDAGCAGLEPFLGVPGTLGGAVFNNSHYTKELIGTYVAAVEVLTPEGEVRWLTQPACEFAYDVSRFHRSGELIVRVLFALTPGESGASLQRVAQAQQQRASTQPLGTANSGCMFKNAAVPEDQQALYDGQTTLSAGWLIDKAGLKGVRVGGAVVSEKHANFLVNTGNATAQDVWDLSELVRERVRQRFGIELEREVFFLGAFKQKGEHGDISSAGR